MDALKKGNISPERLHKLWQTNALMVGEVKKFAVVMEESIVVFASLKLIQSRRLFVMWKSIVKRLKSINEQVRKAAHVVSFYQRLINLLDYTTNSIANQQSYNMYHDCLFKSRHWQTDLIARLLVVPARRLCWIVAFDYRTWEKLLHFY